MRQVLARVLHQNKEKGGTQASPLAKENYTNNIYSATTLSVRASPTPFRKVPATVHTARTTRVVSSNAGQYWPARWSRRTFSCKPETNIGEATSHASAIEAACRLRVPPTTRLGCSRLFNTGDVLLYGTDIYHAIECLARPYGTIKKARRPGYLPWHHVLTHPDA